MKNFNLKIISALIYGVIVFSTATISVSAQKIKEQKFSGNISSLKDQKELNVVLDFTEMMVNNQPEESHITYFTNGKDEEYKEKWLNEWNVLMRDDSYNMLIKGLNNSTNKKFQWSLGDFADAEYTIYVKVINIDPGVFLTKNTRVKADISILKAGEDTPIATMPFNQYAPKSSYVSIPIGQIAAAFNALGVYVGSNISKSIK